MIFASDLNLKRSIDRLDKQIYFLKSPA